MPTRTDRGIGRFEPSDVYVRRFWVAAIGPGAVAELMRLMRAAGKGEEVLLPRYLPILLRTGMVRVDSGELVVAARFTEVPAELRWRFPPSLAAEHSRRAAPAKPA